MKPKISIVKVMKPSFIKNMLKREQRFSNKCTICGMQFKDPKRTKIHMIKAHSKPKKHKEY